MVNTIKQEKSNSTRRPYSLHQFDVWYLVNMFSALADNPQACEKWRKLFVSYGYIEKSNLITVQYLDDIRINLKLFGTEHLELQKIDQLLQTVNFKITDSGLSCGASVFQIVYNKECERKKPQKPDFLLPPYFLLFKEFEETGQ